MGIGDTGIIGAGLKRLSEWASKRTLPSAADIATKVLPSSSPLRNILSNRTPNMDVLPSHTVGTRAVSTPMPTPTPAPTPTATSEATSARFPRRAPSAAAPPQVTRPVVPVMLQAQSTPPTVPQTTDPNAGIEVIKGGFRSIAGQTPDVTEPVSMAQSQTEQIRNTAPRDLWGSNPEAINFRKQMMDAFAAADARARDASSTLQLGRLTFASGKSIGGRDDTQSAGYAANLANTLENMFKGQGDFQQTGFRNVNEAVNAALKTGYEGEHYQTSDINEAERIASADKYNLGRLELEKQELPVKLELLRRQAANIGQSDPAAMMNAAANIRRVEAEIEAGKYNTKYGGQTISAETLKNRGFDPTPSNIEAYTRGDQQYVAGKPPVTGAWASIRGTASPGVPPHMIPKGAVNTGKIDPNTNLPIYQMGGKKFIPSIYGQIPTRKK